MITSMLHSTKKVVLFVCLGVLFVLFSRNDLNSGIGLIFAIPGTLFIWALLSFFEKLSSSASSALKKGADGATEAQVRNSRKEVTIAIVSIIVIPIIWYMVGSYTYTTGLGN
jgi:predicted membrane channel-forming protein YqfA (hemolysin III family)